MKGEKYTDSSNSMKLVSPQRVVFQEKYLFMCPVDF